MCLLSSVGHLTINSSKNARLPVTLGFRTIGELHSGYMDNVSYVQGSTQVLVIIHCPHISFASLSKGWGGLDGDSLVRFRSHQEGGHNVLC